MSESTIFGWTVKQLAYAKKRYNDIEKIELPENMESIAIIKKWWNENKWPEPLSICIVGVNIESDINWAASAYYNSIVNIYDAK